MIDAKRPYRPTRIKVDVGQRFNRLVALFEVRIKDVSATWMFRCDCGVEKLIKVHHVAAGRIVSCGCSRQEHKTKHGLSRSKGYSRWRSMMDRCYKSSSKAFVYYGARGITVCERWHDYASYYADTGDTPRGFSLDRIDNDGNYEPGNCRWATPRQQSENSRSVRPVVLSDAAEFASMASAGRFFGITGATVAWHCKNDRPFNGVAMQYLSDRNLALGASK